MKKVFKHKKEKEILENFIDVAFSIVKGLISSLSMMIWLIAGFFLLISLINYYNQDATSIVSLLILANKIMSTWNIFFIIIWFFDSIIYYKELTNE